MHAKEGTRSVGRRLAGRYGSRRGFVRTYGHRLKYLMGWYRDYRRIDWNSVDRLVFVCKGNICRSAYAEAVARSLGVNASSCGLQTVMGAPANEAAVRTARKMGFSLENHKTTSIMYMVLRSTDLLVAMEPWQPEFMSKRIFRKHNYTLLGLWSEPVLPYLHDPYGTTPEYFERCFTYIEKSVNEIVSKI